MKLFTINKKHESLAIVVPKKLYIALGWIKGDVLQAQLTRDRGIIFRKLELKTEPTVEGEPNEQS